MKLRRINDVIITRVVEIVEMVEVEITEVVIIRRGRTRAPIIIMGIIITTITMGGIIITITIITTIMVGMIGIIDVVIVTDVIDRRIIKIITTNSISSSIKTMARIKVTTTTAKGTVTATTGITTNSNQTKRK